MTRRSIEIRRPATSRGKAFLDELTDRIPGSWVDPRPVDPRFEDVINDIGAMSSSSKLALLEAAGATLRSGEVYLEVGALFGVCTLAVGNARSDVHMIVIDNFSQFGGSADRLTANLERYGLRDRVDLIADDYRAALSRSLPPVGVYLFDGPHDYLDQYVGLELALPHLSDEALVIVDDTRWPHVRRANLDFAAVHPALTLLCDLPSPRLNHPGWWNGLQVFEYRASAHPGRRDIRFHVNRARYAILQPMRRYRIYYPHLRPMIRRIRRKAAHTLRRIGS